MVTHVAPTMAAPTQPTSSTCSYRPSKPSPPPSSSSSSSSSSSPVEPSTSKVSISSHLFSAFAPGSSATPTDASSSSSSRKMPFKPSTFRGLGCTSAAEVSLPEAAFRSSGEWQGKSVRRKGGNGRRRKQGLAGCEVVWTDVWCAPGIGFTADDSVVATRRGNPHTQDRTADAELIPASSERVCMSRRTTNDIERIYGHEFLPRYDAPRPVSDFLPSGHPRSFRRMHRSPGGLSEIIMLQTGFLFRGSDRYDEYRDLRLDVDSMSYEELLELGDKIGYVNTGLKEKEILSCLKKSKHSILDKSQLCLSSASESKCSICQEEYELNEDVGHLGCGHSYHLCCIKQWLQQKNACPVCKFAAS